MTGDSRRRSALVTGASSGIGFAIARMLLDDGFDVTITSSNQERIEKAAGRLDGSHAVVGDVASQADCEYVTAAHRERFGGMDVLVNNAGVLWQSDIVDLELAQWEAHFSVNTTGTFLMTTLSLPMLRPAHGLVVNIASIAGKAANPGLGLAAYAATKAAVISFTQSLNAEVEGDGVRALAICPGFVDTPMATISGLPGEKMIQPSDVAEVVRMALRLSRHARVPEVIIEMAP